MESSARGVRDAKYAIVIIVIDVVAALLMVLSCRSCLIGERFREMVTCRINIAIMS